MHLDGNETLELGSVRDRIRNTVWYRREQKQIFESLINVYANVISVNPDITKKVGSAINEYIDLIVPGSKEFRDREEQNTLARNEAALKTIYAALQQHQKGHTAADLAKMYR